MSGLLKLASMGLVLTLLVVAVGAFTRLSNAGLGCPDWPGCYGQLLAPSNAQQAMQLAASYQGPVDIAKAWIEMSHRYLAASLALVIAALLVWTLLNKVRQVPAAIGLATSLSTPLPSCLPSCLPRSIPTSLPILLPSALAVLIVGQSALGMLTVTLRLHPVVVMGHLAGGLLTLNLLFYYCHQLFYAARPLSLPLSISSNSRWPWLVAATLAVVTVQILLGGWLSANYAAPFCQGLPLGQELSHQPFSLQAA